MPSSKNKQELSKRCIVLVLLADFYYRAFVDSKEAIKFLSSKDFKRKVQSNRKGK